VPTVLLWNQRSCCLVWEWFSVSSWEDWTLKNIAMAEIDMDDYLCLVAITPSGYLPRTGWVNFLGTNQPIL
jgi:hypothetical protein